MTWEELLLRPGLIGADIEIWRDNGPERSVLRGKVKQVHMVSHNGRITFSLWHGRVERSTCAAPEESGALAARSLFVDSVQSPLTVINETTIKFTTAQVGTGVIYLRPIRSLAARSRSA